MDSGCVLLRRRATELIAPEKVRLFVRIVKRAFSERRKVMAKLLKQEWPVERVTMALEKVGVAPQARAETVSLAQFVQITELLSD